MMGKHTYVKHVIKKEGRPVGSVIGLLTPKVFVLNDIYLVPEVRGQGLGRRLIGDLVYNYKKPVVAFGVLKNAVGFYRRLGFKNIPSSFISYKRMRRKEKTVVREVKRMSPWLRQFRRPPERVMFVTPLRLRRRI